MNKFFYAISIIFILFYSQNSYCQYRKFKSVVRSGYAVDLYEYNPFDTIITKQNKKNRVKSIFYFEVSGNGDYFGNVTLDENSNPIEHTNNLYAKQFKGNYKYNKSGKIEEENSDDGKIEFSYNENGLLTKGISINGSTEFKYNDQHSIVEESYFNNEGKYSGKTIYVYEYNKLSNKINYSSEGTKYYERTYSYENGKLINESSINYNNGIYNTTITYKYDSNDNIIEKSNSLTGTIIAFDYNEMNQLIKKEVKGNKDITIEHYVYDKSGCLRGVISMINQKIECYTNITYWYYK